MRPDVSDILQRAPTVARQLAAHLRARLDAFNDVAKLMRHNGELKPEAARWLTRLAADNYVNKTTFHDNEREQARREGRRELALEIIASARLDPARLDRLAEQVREADNE
jgi:hypothetical protein